MLIIIIPVKIAFWGITPFADVAILPYDYYQVDCPGRDTSADWFFRGFFTYRANWRSFKAIFHRIAMKQPTMGRDWWVQSLEANGYLWWWITQVLIEYNEAIDWFPNDYLLTIFFDYSNCWLIITYFNHWLYNILVLLIYDFERPKCQVLRTS